QFVIMGGNRFRSDTQNQIETGIHGGEIIVIRGFCGIVTARRDNRFRIGKGERRKIFRSFSSHPIKGSRSHFGNVLAFGPEESGAKRAEEPFVSGTNHEIDVELTYV